MRVSERGEMVPAERERRRNGVLAMLSTLEGELPRTRGPNPLFWTHTLAHLSLAPDHLQLTLPAPRPVHPCRTYCRLSCLLRHSDSPSIPNGRHGTLPGVLRCCLAERRPPFFPLPPVPSSLYTTLPLFPLSARPPRSILYNYPACITKVAAKLFPPPLRARETAARPFQPLLANSELGVRLTLFLSWRARH